MATYGHISSSAFLDATRSAWASLEMVDRRFSHRGKSTRIFFAARVFVFKEFAVMVRVRFEHFFFFVAVELRFNNSEFSIYLSGMCFGALLIWLRTYDQNLRRCPCDRAALSGEEFS